ncbi:MAG: TlpA family protein disulfide reductase [Dysgonamonadaceae bacterium]|jgi:peroxiredoxin|nr:TlpA family protein disulfide reductase [Dysgonamonadaceae bacterium]
MRIFTVIMFAFIVLQAHAQIENDKDFITLQTSVAAVLNKIRAIEGEYSRLTDRQKRDADEVGAIKERYLKAVDERNKILFNFIGNHPKSYVSLITVAQLNDENQVSKQTLDSLFKCLAPIIQDTDLGKTLKRDIKTVINNTVGSIATDFTQETPDGKPVKLSDFRGKYILIDFWASWCGPCRRENPNIVKAYNKFKNENFTIIGVSLDKSRDAWLNAIETDGLKWIQVSDLNYWDNEAAKTFGIKSIPQNILIDTAGIIIRKNLRGEELQKTLSEIFQ